MVVRLGAAICVAAILACSSLSITQAGIQNHSTLDSAASGPTITGAATTYNPHRPGYRSGGTKTASGEPYDPSAWAGAIQTDLRGMFGGVRFGKDYRPAYALVASADKQVIIKINDVGPLEPGRVIDLNEQTMRYFDPTLERGVIRFIHVTPLLGDDWPPGPIAGDPLVEAGS
jgi:peptidoglycan lytic transglycosylase